MILMVAIIDRFSLILNIIYFVNKFNFSSKPELNQIFLFFILWIYIFSDRNFGEYSWIGGSEHG